MVKEEQRLFHLLLKAGSLAEKIHNGQKDKAGQPYFKHPERVSCELSKMEFFNKNYNLKLMIVALLHDVIEDSNGQVTKTNIVQEFDNEIADAVDAISRRKNETYDDFIERCSKNNLARIVKMEDLKDNMNLMRLVESSYIFEEKDWKRMQKYVNSYRKLRDCVLGFGVKS